jgi:putative transposase
MGSNLARGSREIAKELDQSYYLTGTRAGRLGPLASGIMVGLTGFTVPSWMLQCSTWKKVSTMAKKQFSPEQAVTKLRQIEVLVSGGKSICKACKEVGITDVTYYRWRREYEDLRGDQANRLKELKRENASLKSMVAGLLLEKAILKDAAEEFSEPRAQAASTSVQSLRNLPARD